MGQCPEIAYQFGNNFRSKVQVPKSLMEALMKLNQGLTVFWILALALVGCSRPESEQTKVSLALPGFEASGGAVDSFGKIASLSESGVHIAINITGDGVNVFCSFDSKHNLSAGPCFFAGGFVELSLPSGSNRLFQVFYAEDTSSGSTMTYGETRVDMTGSSVQVQVSVLPIGANATHFMDFGGRYLENSSAGLVPHSGLLEMKYHPPSGSPAMTIMESEMYSGWFKAFSIDSQGLEFSYEVSGSVLFKEIDSSGKISFDDLAAHMANYSSRFAIDTDGDHSLALGWFGPGVVSQFATDDDANCDNTANKVPWVDCLVNGYELSKIHPPFRSTSLTDQSLSESRYHTGNFYLATSFLPGLNPGSIAGDSSSKVKVYRLSNVSSVESLKPFLLDEGRWDCEKISQVGTFLGDATYISADSYGVLKGTFAANDVAVFCPFVYGSLRTQAVVYPSFYNAVGSGGYSGPYLHINLAAYNGGNLTHDSSQDKYTIQTGKCYSIGVGSYIGAGNSYSVSISVSVAVTSTESDVKFYALGTDCVSGSNESSSGATAISSGSSMDAGGNMYMKVLSYTGDLTIQITSNSSEHYGFPQQIYVQ